MLNNVSIEGRVTKEPELKRTGSEKAVITTTIACQRLGKKDEADFITIVIWGKQAENFVKYVKKGQMISVNGRLQSRSYKSNDGATRYVTEVVANYRGINYIGGFSKNKGKNSNNQNNEYSYNNDSSHNGPSYNDNSYNETPYNGNSYDEHSYNGNSYNEPSYNEPSYNETQYSDNSHNEPSYNTEDIYNFNSNDLKMDW